MFPSVAASPPTPGPHVAHRPKEAQDKRKRYLLTLKYPVDHDIVTNLENMMLIWHHTFHNEQCVARKQHSVLLSKAPISLKCSRENKIQIIKFQQPQPLYMVIRAVLSSYLSGEMTGIILHSCQEVTYVVPMYEGYAFPQNKILTDQAYCFTTTTTE